MEVRVKFLSAQNISGASQQKRIAAFSQTAGAAVDLIWSHAARLAQPSLWKLRDPKLIWKDVIYPLFIF